MVLFALQTPVASDLRLLTALLHMDLHLERVADMAVNIAKIVKVAWALPGNTSVVEQLERITAEELHQEVGQLAPVGPVPLEY